MERLQVATNESANAQYHDNVDAEASSRPTRKHSWTTPTLRLLASCRTVKLAFCPEVAHLRAYLAAYACRESQQQDTEGQDTIGAKTTRLLAVLNPIQLHRPTSAFSAQGLNRTLSIAVEAAYHTRSCLILAEIPGHAENTPPEDVPMFGEEAASAAQPATNPWDEEVSILNVTTKSFGAGERGWVGRTVKIRAIAQRWCVFEKLTPAED